MNNQPRRTLKRLFQQYGQALVDDPRRTEALLRDYCGQHRREIFVLINAQKQQIPTDLLSPPRWIPTSVLHERLSRRLQEKLALTPEAADWAVEAWATVLDVPPPADFKNKAPQRRQATRSSVDHAKTSSGSSAARRKAGGRQFSISDVQLGYYALLHPVERMASRLRLTSDFAWGRMLRSVLRTTRDRIPKTFLWFVISLLVLALGWAVWLRDGSVAQLPNISQSLAFPTVVTVTELSTGDVASSASAIIGNAYPLPRTAWVEADHLNVRSAPSLDGQLISGLANGTPVTVEEYSPDVSWARISDPFIGWVSVTYLYFQAEADQETFVHLGVGPRLVRTANLNVYESPADSAPIQDQISAEAQVLVVATTRDNQWSHIVYPNFGWVTTGGLR